MIYYTRVVEHRVLIQQLFKLLFHANTRNRHVVSADKQRNARFVLKQFIKRLCE